MGGSVDSKEDTAGLVVSEQPKEEKPAVDPSVKTQGENLDLGDKTEKEPSQDNSSAFTPATKLLNSVTHANVTIFYSYFFFPFLFLFSSYI